MRSGIFNTGFPRITLVFSLIIIVVILNVVFNYFIISRNKTTIVKMTEVINPYLEGLEDLNEILIESKMYSTNWVYLQNNIEDKKSLEELHKKRYPEIKEWLNSFIDKFKATEGMGTLKADSLSGVFRNFEALIIVEKEIMSTLSSFDDYENPKMKFIAEDLIESEVLPRTDQIMKQLNVIMRENKEEATKMKKRIEDESMLMTSIMLISSFGLLAFVVISMIIISNNIRKPVQKMNQIVQTLAKGEIPDDKVDIQKNVIGEMVVSVHALTDSFKQTSEFANEIGKGNLSAEYNKLGENDMLGNALIHMRDSLKAYAHDMEQKVNDRTFEVIEKSKKLEHAYK
ncbi:MAG TPA: hypothetical protein PLU73_04370, partial [Bacteroidia bacterium]|nr:hypothetical protein [Bacteroidia bacterium]